MSQKAIIAAIASCNLAMLIATSEAEFGAHDEAGPFEIALAPDSPRLLVSGAIEAGDVVGYASLSLRFEGTNQAAASGQLELYVLPDDAVEIPEGAQPDASKVITAKAGEPLPLDFSLGDTLDRTQFDGFRVLLALEGEADLQGSLTVQVSTSSSEDSPQLWLELKEVEVGPLEVDAPGDAP